MEHIKTAGLDGSAASMLYCGGSPSRLCAGQAGDAACNLAGKERETWGKLRKCSGT